MTLRERLLAKRANFIRSMSECDIRILQASQQVRNAKRGLQIAREAQAATQAGLQVLDETLAELPPDAPAKPTPGA